MHLLQGVYMKAWLRNDASGGCYSDIPIQLRTHAGKTMNIFATPLSLIVQPTSPSINCSNTPVMFQAKGGDWFSVTEKGLQLCKSPLKLALHPFIWRNIDLGLNWLSILRISQLFRGSSTLKPPSTMATRQRILHFLAE